MTYKYETTPTFSTPMHYYKEIEKLIEEINKATGVEWTHMETGGGCDCLEYATDNNTYIITDGQASAPVDDETGYILGVYHQDLYSQPDPIAQFDTETLAECATKFRELLAQ
jgi:hypothetical protein